MKLLSEITEKKEMELSIAYEMEEEDKDQNLSKSPPLSPIVKRTDKDKIESSEMDKISSNEIWFNSFQIINLLGQGSFGKVFHVKMKTSDEEYAMKVLNKSILVQNKHLKYALSEWNILKQISWHFIVTLHYAFQTASNLYLVLDYWENGDLSSFIDEKGFLTEQEALFVLWQMVWAIEYLHSQNIVYRDMKPENILVDSDNNWKLADFGLAKENVFDSKTKSSFWGSPAYLPPELIKNNITGKESDYYQLGIVLYEMLVGVPPFFNENMNVLYRSIQKGDYSCPTQISEQVQDLISKLLHKNPKSRLDLDGIKSHPVFEDVDWNKVSLRQIESPLKYIFNHEEESKLMPQIPIMFEDEDYKNSEETLNRVKGFSFMK